MTLRVTFVLPSFGPGGAERHAATLVNASDPGVVEFDVVCVDRLGDATTPPDAARAIRHLGAAGKPARLPRAAFRLARQLRRTRPDVVMTAGFSAEVVGRFAARAVGVPYTIAWKHNTGHVGHYGMRDKVLERLTGWAVDAYFGVAWGQLAYLSGYLGLPGEKVTVVHNGVDEPAIMPAAGQQLLSELGVARDAPVVAVIAGLRA